MSALTLLGAQSFAVVLTLPNLDFSNKLGPEEIWMI